MIIIILFILMAQYNTVVGNRHNIHTDITTAFPSTTTTTTLILSVVVLS